MNLYSIDVMSATPADKLADYKTAEGEADTLYNFLLANKAMLEIPNIIQIHISVIKESRMVQPETKPDPTPEEKYYA